MKPAITLLAATLALGLAACTNDNDANDPSDAMAGAPAQTGTTAGDASGTSAGATADVMAPAVHTPVGPVAGAPAAEGDRKALAAVMEVDRHEIAAAGDALAKNVQGDVRSYAETLREDHTRNLEATRRLMGDTTSDGDMAAHTAQNPTAGTAAGPGASTDAMAGHAPSDPELVAMKEKHDAERARLSALEGEAFATAWLQAMVKGHEEALAKLDDELIPGAGDAGVKQHLQDTRRPSHATWTPRARCNPRRSASRLGAPPAARGWRPRPGSGYVVMLLMSTAAPLARVTRLVSAPGVGSATGVLAKTGPRRPSHSAIR